MSYLPIIIIPIIWIFLIDMLIITVLYISFVLLSIRCHYKKEKYINNTITNKTSVIIQDLQDKISGLRDEYEGNFNNYNQEEDNMSNKEFVDSQVKKGYESKYTRKGKELSLDDIEYAEGEEKHYNRVVELMKQMTLDAWGMYAFQYKKSKSVEEDNHIAITISGQIYGEEIREIFSLCVDYNLDYTKIEKLFKDELVAGNVIPLGDNIVIIGLEKGDLTETGISEIQSGLSNQVVAVQISYIRKENYEAWEEFVKEMKSYHVDNSMTEENQLGSAK